jgi:hypothetical protein
MQLLRRGKDARTGNPAGEGRAADEDRGNHFYFRVIPAHSFCHGRRHLWGRGDRLAAEPAITFDHLLPFQTVSPYRFRPGIGPLNVATYYLINSRRKMAICSGSITAFFRSIASAKIGGEAKLVQPGLIRARIFNGVWRGLQRGWSFQE